MLCQCPLPRTEEEQNLWEIYCINSEDNFDQFHTDIKEVFQAFRYREDKEKLKTLLLEELAEEAGNHMEKDENGKEHYNMCKALMEIREEGREIGEKIGEKNGDNSRTRIVVTNMLKRGDSTEDICAIAE